MLRGSVGLNGREVSVTGKTNIIQQRRGDFYMINELNNNSVSFAINNSIYDNSFNRLHCSSVA